MSEVQVCVVMQERYDKGPFFFGESWTPGTLNRVIDSLIAIRDSIPEEYRAVASCQIDSESGYEGSHYASIEVCYRRPETADEEQKRLEAEHRRRTSKVAEERRLYEALRAKFG